MRCHIQRGVAAQPAVRSQGAFWWPGLEGNALEGKRSRAFRTLRAGSLGVEKSIGR